MTADPRHPARWWCEWWWTMLTHRPQVVLLPLLQFRPVRTLITCTIPQSFIVSGHVVPARPPACFASNIAPPLNCQHRHLASLFASHIALSLLVISSPVHHCCSGAARGWCCRIGGLCAAVLP